MKIAHFSNNSLAGAPIRLVQALNRQGAVSARLIDTQRFGLYEHDLVFQENPEQALEIAEQADIIHLHNFLDENSNDFHPIDFRKLLAKGKPVLRHFHSIPELVALRMGRTEREVLENALPSVVIAQYPERFYPRARVVPNLVPQDEPEYLPNPAKPKWDVFFAPTKPYGAFENRWNTKGAPETLAMLARLKARTGCALNARDGASLVPLAQIMAEKAQSRIVLDDMVNGSYHLSGLEGLCLGRPVLNYLDERTLSLFREFSGADHCPFINVRLEEALPVLEHLLAHPDEAAGLGAYSREWIERYWRDTRLAGHFLDVYADLAADPARIKRQEHLRLDGVKRFYFLTQPDLLYASRKRNYPQTRQLHK